MAAVRKDNRGIVLRKGESQDKNGRYRYRYYDDMQQGHDVYSWTLRPEDATPEGKKAGLSLRELETQIQKDIADNLKTWNANITVNKLCEEYRERQKTLWANSTLNGFDSAYKTHIKAGIGKKKVSKVTSDEIEKFYDSMLKDNAHPVQIGTVAAVNKILNAVFKMAVKRSIIRNNPVTGCIGSVKARNRIEKKQKHALEEREQGLLLEYIKNNPKYSQYYPMFYVMAWTGCRIGELLGLSWYDLDFKREVITINRSLIYKPINGHYQFYLSNTKTRAGVREIPMLGKVKEILLEMRKEAGSPKVFGINAKTNLTIADKDSFVFRNSRGNFHPPVTIEHLLRKIVRAYEVETDVVLSTDITPHSFRHSFCCWLCENVQGENSMDDLKLIQSIIGHADAGTTLNIYSELRKENAAGKHEALKKRAMQV